MLNIIKLSTKMTWQQPIKLCNCTKLYTLIYKYTSSGHDVENPFVIRSWSNLASLFSLSTLKQFIFLSFYQTRRMMIVMLGESHPPGQALGQEGPAPTSTSGSLSRSCCCSPGPTGTTSTGSTGRRASSRLSTLSKWLHFGERERYL